MIAGPYVINLENRTDRWDFFKQQIKDYDLQNASRFDAVHNANGILGCLQSHTNALKNAPADAAAVWICEDDCRFLIPKEELEFMIQQFMESDADMLMIENHFLRQEPYDNYFARALEAHNMGSYIVKPRMRAALIKIYDEAYEDRVWNRPSSLRDRYMSLPSVFKCEQGFYAADQCYKVLFEEYIIIGSKLTRTAKQIPSFSDIGKCFTQHAGEN